jgi:hypothetical protein
MVRILVDHNRIRIPEPIGDVRKIFGRDAKVCAPEPESVGTSAFQTEHVTWSKAQGKASVFERTIYVVASIIATIIVPHPFAIGMHVRSLRMPLKIAETALLTASTLLPAAALLRSALHGSLLLHRGWPLLRSPLLRSLSSGGRRSMRRNVPTTNATLVALIPMVASAPLSPIPLLRKTHKRNAKRQHSESYYILLHECLRVVRRARGMNHLSIKPL